MKGKPELEGRLVEVRCTLQGPLEGKYGDAGAYTQRPNKGDLWASTLWPTPTEITKTRNRKPIGGAPGTFLGLARRFAVAGFSNFR